MLNLLYAITLIISFIAAVLAWVSKIRWSKEYISATNQIIKNKDTQIEILKSQLEIQKEIAQKNITLWECNSITKQQIDKIYEEKDNELKKLLTDIQEKKQKIEKLETDGINKIEETKKMQEELHVSVVKTRLLQFQLNLLQKNYTDRDKDGIITLPDIFLFPETDATAKNMTDTFFNELLYKIEQHKNNKGELSPIDFINILDSLQSNKSYFDCIEYILDYIKEFGLSKQEIQSIQEEENYSTMQ